MDDHEAYRYLKELATGTYCHCGEPALVNDYLCRLHRSEVSDGPLSSNVSDVMLHRLRGESVVNVEGEGGMSGVRITFSNGDTFNALYHSYKYDGKLDF